MNDITPKEASEILSHYTDIGYGVVIEGEDTSKIKQALDLAIKALKDKEVADNEQEAYEFLVCLQEEMRQKGREEQYNALQVAIDRLKRR